MERCVCVEPKCISVVAGVANIGFWTFLFVITVLKWLNLKENEENFHLFAILLPLLELIFIVNIILSCLLVYGCIKQSGQLLLPWITVTGLEICILLLTALINYNNFYGNLIAYLTISGTIGYLISAIFLLLFCVYLWANVLLYYKLIYSCEYT